ncbi:MAG: NFACT family protein [Clostridia bacterium]|nr:NFACT family protein [Clostridia bacterium]
MQDLFTIKKIARELNGLIVGAKVNKVFQPLSDEVNFVLYSGKSFRLILSAKPSLARVSVSNKEKENPLVAPNFCMLLRKHLLGAEITSVSVFNDDRIIAITFTNKTELLDSKTFIIYAEIMGKYSNVFLTENGVLLGALKQVPQGLDDKRVTLTGATYAPPQKPEKLSVELKNVKSVLNAFSGGDLKSYLLNSFHEFSPVTAGELASAISSSNDKVTAFVNFLEKPISPVVITSELSSDFYAFDYKTVLGERTYFSSVIDAQEFVYSSKENAEQFKTVKNTVLTPLTSHRKKLTKKLALYSDKIIESGEIEKLKLYGELITCNLYKLKKGQKSAVLTNYGETVEEVTVMLDELLSPQENAKKYFKLYRKKKTALEMATKQVLELESELKYLDSVFWELETATTVLDLLEIKKELIVLGIIKEQNPKKQKKELPLKPIKYVVEGYEVLVGRNNLQNEYLYQTSSRQDFWLHVKNYPSSHVYIKCQGECSESVLKTCAEICAFYSSANGGGKVSVDYALRKHLKKPAGAKLGSVIYTDFKTILVEPNKHFAKQKTDL